MCCACWENDYGAPELDSGTIRRAMKLIRDVYSQPMASALHVELLNWNLGDDTLACCVDNADLTDVEDACARHLLTMTEEERASALARHDQLVT